MEVKGSVSHLSPREIILHPVRFVPPGAFLLLFPVACRRLPLGEPGVPLDGELDPLDGQGPLLLSQSQT